jgi:hypothetical protein
VCACLLHAAEMPAEGAWSGVAGAWLRDEGKAPTSSPRAWCTAKSWALAVTVDSKCWLRLPAAAKQSGVLWRCAVLLFFKMFCTRNMPLQAWLQLAAVFVDDVVCSLGSADLLWWMVGCCCLHVRRIGDVGASYMHPTAISLCAELLLVELCNALILVKFVSLHFRVRTATESGQQGCYIGLEVQGRKLENLCNTCVVVLQETTYNYFCKDVRAHHVRWYASCGLTIWQRLRLGSRLCFTTHSD